MHALDLIVDSHRYGFVAHPQERRIVARSVDSQTVVNGQLAWSLPTTGLALRFGIDNLFDEPSPFVDGEDRAGVDAQNFVIDGRTVYVRATVTFGASGGK